MFQGMIMVTVDIEIGIIMMIIMKIIIKDNISREWIASMQRRCDHTANKLTVGECEIYHLACYKRIYYPSSSERALCPSEP